MRKIKKLFSFFLFLSFLGLIFTRSAEAFCPLCVVSTGAGLGLFRWLGVDDTIVGLWLGGFIAALANWLNNSLKAKRKEARFQLPVIIGGLYLSLLLLAKELGFFSGHHNRLWGINKFVLGVIVGSLILFFSPWLDRWLKEKNGGRAVIKFQKIIVTVSLLAVFSLIFQYCVTHYHYH